MTCPTATTRPPPYSGLGHVRQDHVARRDHVECRYDLGNRLTSWNGATVVHDNNGNMTSDGTFTYTYKPRNQVTLLKHGNQTPGQLHLRRSWTPGREDRRWHDHQARLRPMEPGAGAGL